MDASEVAVVLGGAKSILLDAVELAALSGSAEDISASAAVAAADESDDGGDWLFRG